MGYLKQLPPILGKLIPMLASDQDGEVLSTVRAIRRALSGAGMDLHDLVGRLTVPVVYVHTPSSPEPPPRPKKPRRPKDEARPPPPPKREPWGPVDRARFCLLSMNDLNDKEKDFLRSLLRPGFGRSRDELGRYPSEPSPRQAEWLNVLWSRAVLRYGDPQARGFI